MFPEASAYAYQTAAAISLPDLVSFCDLQMTKDGSGICHSNIRLENFTNINQIFPKQEKTYTVNGKPMSGWFTIDYTVDQLLDNVTCKFVSLRVNIFFFAEFYLSLIIFSFFWI